MTSHNQNSDNLNSNELERALSEMKGMKVPSSSRSKEDAWNLLMQSVVEQESQTNVFKMFNTKVWFAVAASVVIFIAAGWSYAWFSTIEKYSPKGYVSDVILPDGSLIKLNADSRIQYPKFFNLIGRKIKLEGEAFFKVKPGDNFTVTDSDSRIVQVVGTEFNVNSRGKTFKVACFDGAVNVVTPNTERVELTKGQIVESIEGELNVVSFPVDSINTPTWINGEFYFKSAKLSDVFHEIENQFNVTIQVEGFNASERTYSGFFRNDTLKNAMDLVALPMGLSYSFNRDSSIVVIKN